MYDDMGRARRQGLGDTITYKQRMKTLDQIGKHFSLSRERVRQIEREVMAKLRHGERADKLRAYAS